MAENDEPTLEEVIAMHLWKTLPADVPLYIKLPGEASPDTETTNG